MYALPPPLPPPLPKPSRWTWERWTLCAIAVWFVGKWLFVHDRPPNELSGVVTGITDGDTISVLRNDEREFKIRLQGIDAPERDQPYGKRSKIELGELVYDKEVVVTVSDVDSYGRLVGRVLCADVDINAEMVRQGYAWVFVKYTDDPTLKKAEEEARTIHRALWSDPHPVPPWDWRSAKRAK